MKKLFAAISFVLVFGSWSLAQEGTSPASYFPLKKDATWTYSLSGGSVQVKVIGPEKVGNEDCFKLETSANGKPTANEHVAVGKDGAIYRHQVNGVKPDAPIQFFPKAVKAGETWQVNTKVQGKEIKGTFTTKLETVKVKAGEYKDALLVSGTDFKIDGQDTVIKCWYASGVGIVKMEFKLGGQDAVLELEKVEGVK